MTSRKRPRPGPSDNSRKDTVPPDTGVASLVPSASSSHGMSPTKPGHLNTSTSTFSRNEKKVRKTKSWYGSWPRVSKSSPSIQVARENIMGDTRRSEAAADFSRFETNKKEASTHSVGQSTGTLRTDTETNTKTQQDESVSPTRPQEIPSMGDGPADEDTERGPENSSEGLDGPGPSEDITANSTGWLSWLSRSTPQQQNGPTNDNTEGSQTGPVAAQPPQQLENHHAESLQETSQPTKQPGPWFGFWSSSTNATTQETGKQALKNEVTVAEESKVQENGDVAMQDAPMQSAPAPAPVPATTQPSAGSTWAFWSREPAKKIDREASSSEQGELAVMGDGSETHPRKSSIEVSEENSNKKELLAKPPQDRLQKDARRTKAKRNRPQSMDIDEPATVRPGTPDSEVTVKNLPSKPDTTSTHKALPPNLLLPSFKATYRMKENPSIIKQIAQFLLRTQQSPTKHVFLSKEIPPIKKALAIGVHGLFPASYLRPMIGQPTGTSIKFANHCAEAIRRWTESNGSSDCEIEKVALEGEGKIADRVNNLWKLLLNWIEHIKNADLIMLACHSQGVPVSIMLLAKLIDLGVITNSRIGVCAMAGVSLGPFPDYKSGMGMLMGSAAELWQFADPESEISKRYEHALKTVVDYGARITYIGSLDDQLVPLESALYGPAYHPYIYRAVFIDGRNHAPDFIAHLVGFALRLRNLGVSDHGLIRELSVPLAGSLYSGEGHSRLYDEDQVYDLAISHTLETTSVFGVPCDVQKHQGLSNPNPYVLPWIMRGLLEEDFVKRNFEETEELLRQFDDWQPTTKALKDVKYRLEAVRSKL
ncbi:hypothetical protein F5B22DRAFT_586917 [Xylaria bambusicola]|uniref:uncharacterized protein n=1 Tax=Xylaria bambusicola TaxID=326684 RepID=UPI002008370D|nr:uncharacterized protein F5B22DRAFT_586917 [Xylaria bambusicola]KAI0526660.1 hypothetical protein F5B22DRAFT_586917 [Xylaria bambusicola]